MTSEQAAMILRTLVTEGKLTEEQLPILTADFEKKDKPVDVYLVENRLVDDESVAKAKAVVFGLPYAEVVGKDLSPNIINIFPKATAENYRAVAFERDGEAVKIGLVNPGDTQVTQGLDFLVRQGDLHPTYFTISNASLNYALKKYEALGKEVATALEIAKDQYSEGGTSEKGEEQVIKLEEVIKGAPVSRIVAVLLKEAVDAGASDIHIEPFGEESRVRYRIDGVLKQKLSLPKYIHASIVSRIKVLASLKLDETRVPQDGRISEVYGGKAIDFRVSTMPLMDSEKVVMRVLDTTRGVPTLQQLGFRKEHIDVILREIRQPHGMILVSGPTGSGKSTTLFTILSMRNEEGVNISTLEDPVEYFIKGVNQAQIRPEVGFTFSAGLRALLRQDPNVIMVGEVRDGETGELAIHAALTGHMIYTTIHTNDAMGIVPRLLDMKLEPFLLSATMKLAVAQRLARKICERCKMPFNAQPEVVERFRTELRTVPAKWLSGVDVEGPLTFFKGIGCTRCNNFGYTGRVAVAELVEFDEQMCSFVNAGFPVEKVKAYLESKGNLTLRQDAVLKVLEGLTTIEELYRVTAD